MSEEWEFHCYCLSRIRFVCCAVLCIVISIACLSFAIFCFASLGTNNTWMWFHFYAVRLHTVRLYYTTSILELGFFCRRVRTNTFVWVVEFASKWISIHFHTHTLCLPPYVSVTIFPSIFSVRFCSFGSFRTYCVCVCLCTHVYVIMLKWQYTNINAIECSGGHNLCACLPAKKKLSWKRK